MYWVISTSRPTIVCYNSYMYAYFLKNSYKSEKAERLLKIRVIYTHSHSQKSWESFVLLFMLFKSLDGMYPQTPFLTAVRRVVSGAFFNLQKTSSWRKWVHSGLFKQIPPQWSALLGSWPMSWPTKSQSLSHWTPDRTPIQWSRPGQMEFHYLCITTRDICHFIPGSNFQGT